MSTETPPHPSARLHSEQGLQWWEWAHPTTGVRQMELTGVGILPREDMVQRAGEFIRDQDYVLLVREDCDLYRPRETSALDMLLGGGAEDRPEDRLLITYRKGVFPREECARYREALRGAAQVSRNRGNAAGELDLEELRRELGARLIVESKTRASYYTIDGLRSQTTISNTVHSGILGYFNSVPRNPYCRQTSYTRQFPDKFATATEFVRQVDREFRRLIPGRWAAQNAFIQEHDIAAKGWSVEGTAFTTMTVNRNYRTGLHLDDGDLLQGFGNLTVLEGDGPGYDGGYTVFPQYRVGVDVRTGDFVGMDVHEWHGNTALIPRVPGDTSWERISLVCYCRELISRCGPRAAEEAKQARWEASAGHNSYSKHFKNVAERAQSEAELQNLLRELSSESD